MKVNPYVSFNGNCAEAIEFYAKVFDSHVEIMRYKDAPPDSGYQMPEDKEELQLTALEAAPTSIFLIFSSNKAKIDQRRTLSDTVTMEIHPRGKKNGIM